MEEESKPLPARSLNWTKVGLKAYPAALSLTVISSLNWTKVGLKDRMRSRRRGAAASLNWTKVGLKGIRT